MKKITFCIILLYMSSIVLLPSFGSNDPKNEQEHVSVQLNSFDNFSSNSYLTFEAFLVQEGYDDIVDGVITSSKDLEEITILDLSYTQLKDLDGIEYLIGLERLYVNGNNFQKKLDLSNNINLKYLNLDSSNVSELNVENNTLLEVLIAGNNELSEINLSNNLLLSHLELKNNHITFLNVAKNTLLEFLSVKENEFGLEVLTLGNNPSLKYLYASDNNLDNIDLSGVLNLIELHLDNNNLSGVLDLSILQKLEIAELCGNNLVGLLECSIRITLPQKFDTLEEYMVYAGLDTDNIVNKIIQPRSDVSTMRALDITARGISDMTGIEYFTSLEELYMPANNVSNLNLSNNNLLRVLDVRVNGLTALEVLNLANLEALYAGTNLINNVDLSNNSSLTTLSLKRNNLKSLDLTANQSLTFLEVQENELVTLYLGDKMVLTHLYASNNMLSFIDVSEALNLTTLELENNILEGVLDLDRNTSLLSLRLGGNLLNRVLFNNKYNSRVKNENFSIHNNPNLTCVKVDDVTYSKLNWTTYVDDSSVFVESDDCTASENSEVVLTEVKVTDGKIEMPFDVVDMKIYKISGEVVSNIALAGVYYVSMENVNGNVKMNKILVD